MEFRIDRAHGFALTSLCYWLFLGCGGGATSTGSTERNAAGNQSSTPTTGVAGGRANLADAGGTTNDTTVLGVGGNGGIAGAGANTTSGPSTDTTYDPPPFPALSVGPCRYAALPRNTLCGGRANCPVLFDARFGLDHLSSRLDLTPAVNATSYIAYNGNNRSTVSLCLLTTDSAGSMSAVADPFAVAQSFPTSYIVLATDSTDSPHVFLTDISLVRHHHKIDQTWIADDISVPNRVGAELGGAIQSQGKISVLFRTHDPDPGWYKSETLHLASRDGSGSWTQELVFDGGGTTEIGIATLLPDLTGEAVVVLPTRTDSAQLWAHSAWRLGKTTPVAGAASTLMASIIPAGDATSMTLAMVRADAKTDLGLVILREGQPSRELVIPGTATTEITGCPVDLATPSPSSPCQGHVGEICTRKGFLRNAGAALRQTEDGALWVGFGATHLDQDVILRETCATGSDPNCYCNQEVVTDRSVTDLYLARAASVDATNLDVRFKARMLPSTSSPSSVGVPSTLLRASGKNLHVVYIDGHYNPTLYRYIVVDTARL